MGVFRHPPAGREGKAFRDIPLAECTKANTRMKNLGGLIEAKKRGEQGPERHHNPYLDEAVGLGEVLVTQEELLARFPDRLFSGDPRPKLIEIGCYLGKNVVEFAQLNPHIDVLGIDITYKRVVKSARKINTLGLGNARIGICDARVLVEHAAPASFGGVCVFFPDPWPKKRHVKNRLLAQEFLDTLRTRIAPGGFFWFKTDSLRYFEDVMECIAEGGWSVSPADEVPHELTPSPYVTMFEQMFLSRGEPVYRRVFRPTEGARIEDAPKI